MRKIAVVLMLALVTMMPAFAGHQVSIWRSSTGSEITMIGTENMQFQIQVVTPQGQSLIYPAWWIQVKNSFGYNANGTRYYCTYTNRGWSILARSDAQTAQWDFVRWVSK